MKKVLHIFGCIILLIIAIGIAVYFYVFRQQEIALRLIPNEFEYCGKQISTRDSEYKEIVSWLKKNKDGWVLSFATYVPQQVYRHPAFVVNVIKGGVVVSYKTDSGYPQYAKTIEHGLEMACAKSTINKRLLGTW